jgi:peroxiredoxin/outer membrane lipoprotein-sorting protein
MKVIHTYATALLCLGPITTFQAATAIAQPESKSPKPAIDAGARASIERMRTAYLRLNSYSATIDIQEKIGERTSASHIKLLFQQPSLIKVSGTHNGQPISNLSDGRAFYIVRRKVKAGGLEYAQMPMPPASVGRLALMQWTPASFLFTPLLAGVDLFNEPWGKRPKSISRGPAGRVGAALVETVIVEYPKEKITYYFGSRDYLVRRIEYSTGTGARRFSLTETHADIKINPKLPASTLTWIRPQGATPIDWGPQAKPEIKVGAEPFEFEAKDLHGKPLRLSDYKGRVVLLDFWATWCGPCLREVPHVRAAYEKYKNEGFDIMGISLDNKLSDLPPFTRKHKMPWRQIFDGNERQSKIARLYGVNGIPFTLLIGRDGKIAAVNPQMLLLEPAIQEALRK